MLAITQNARPAISTGRPRSRRWAVGRGCVTDSNLRPMSVPQDAAALARQLAAVPLFENLTLETLTPIIALGHLIRMEAAAFFFNDGDEADTFYMLIAGRVKLTQVTPEGHQVVLGHVGPGDAFGGVGA